MPSSFIEPMVRLYTGLTDEICLILPAESRLSNLPLLAIDELQRSLSSLVPTPSAVDGWSVVGQWCLEDAVAFALLECQLDHIERKAILLKIGHFNWWSCGARYDPWISSSMGRGRKAKLLALTV